VIKVGSELIKGGLSISME